MAHGGRMNVLAMARRVARMGPREIAARGFQALGARRDTLLHRLGRDPFPTPAGLDVRGNFFVDAGDVPAIAALIRVRLPEEAGRAVDGAGRVLDRRFDLLGYRDLDFGRDIDWSLDPISGRRAPMVPWPSVPYLDFDAVGDHKVVWELNRHQFLVTLARAYRLTGEARFARGARELWYDWRRKNPYPLGINWASALEVALRALSWMWTGFLLEGTPEASGEFDRDLAREIARSAWYVSRFPSTYFAPNTHLLGEGAALWMIGARYPGLPGAARWRAQGRRIVLQQARRQVRADGLHFEQSIYYHVYALDMLLHARQMAARNGEACDEIDRAIRPMAAALAQLSAAGALPRFGDDDGGRLFDPARNRPEHMTDPLSTAAALFGEPAWKAAAGGLREETLWLCGAEAAARFDRLPAGAPPSRSLALAGAGIYVMAASGDEARRLYIDAGEQGSLAAGHGHADALSVQLAAGGRLPLADPGTLRYMGNAGERNLFRGTRAHNTLTVDGRDQAEPAGPFSWGPRPLVETRRWMAGERFDLFEGRHSGYQRLPEPVTHTRWVVRFAGGFWLVRDAVKGSGLHDFEIAWHFAPWCSVERRGTTIHAAWGDDTVTLAGAAGEQWTPAVEQGVWSPAYGAVEPASVARWSARAACPAEFACAIGFGREGATGLLECMRGEGASGYRFTAGGLGADFWFAHAPGAWEAGGWSSDSAALCVVHYPEGAAHLLMAGGTRAARDGRTAASNPRGLDAVEVVIPAERERPAGPAAIEVHGIV
jgi:hypothetical protein